MLFVKPVLCWQVRGLFGAYGNVIEVVILKDKKSGLPQGIIQIFEAPMNLYRQGDTNVVWLIWKFGIVKAYSIQLAI